MKLETVTEELLVGLTVKWCQYPVDATILQWYVWNLVEAPLLSSVKAFTYITLLPSKYVI